MKKKLSPHTYYFTPSLILKLFLYHYNHLDMWTGFQIMWCHQHWASRIFATGGYCLTCRLLLLLLFWILLAATRKIPNLFQFDHFVCEVQVKKKCRVRSFEKQIVQVVCDFRIEIRMSLSQNLRLFFGLLLRLINSWHSNTIITDLLWPVMGL